MTEKPSAKPNRDFAEGLLEAARAEIERDALLRRQIEQQHERRNDHERAGQIREQIEATKQNGRENNLERLRELGKEHYRLTGAGGKAV